MRTSTTDGSVDDWTAARPLPESKTGYSSPLALTNVPAIGTAETRFITDPETAPLDDSPGAVVLGFPLRSPALWPPAATVTVPQKESAGSGGVERTFPAALNLGGPLDALPAAAGFPVAAGAFGAETMPPTGAPSWGGAGGVLGGSAPGGGAWPTDDPLPAGDVVMFAGVVAGSVLAVGGAGAGVVVVGGVLAGVVLGGVVVFVGGGVVVVGGVVAGVVFVGGGVVVVGGVVAGVVFVGGGVVVVGGVAADGDGVLDGHGAGADPLPCGLTAAEPTAGGLARVAPCAAATITASTGGVAEAFAIGIPTRANRTATAAAPSIRQ